MARKLIVTALLDRQKFELSTKMLIDNCAAGKVIHTYRACPDNHLVQRFVNGRGVTVSQWKYTSTSTAPPYQLNPPQRYETNTLDLEGKRDQDTRSARVAALERLDRTLPPCCCCSWAQRRRPWAPSPRGCAPPPRRARWSLHPRTPITRTPSQQEYACRHGSAQISSTPPLILA